MHPIFLRLGPITIYTYGIFIASAFLLGISLASREAKKAGIDPQKILDLCFYIILSAIIGARILFILVNYKDFAASPLSIFKIWEGGLVYYGGLILSFFTALFFVKKHNMDVWKTADLLTPSIAAGEAVGRWGCLFAGCCYGKETDLPWAITFSDTLSLAPLHVKLHPTQVYASIAALITFLILIAIRKSIKTDGVLFWLYLLIYSVGRYAVEIFRGDDRGYLIKDILSTSQFISIFVFIISISMILKFRKGRVFSDEQKD